MAQQTVTVTGNLIDDPHLNRNIDGKNQVTRIRIAASRSVRDGENWQTYDQLYINGEMWGDLAKNAKASLVKGMPVIATGTLVTNEWDDPKLLDADGKALKRQEVRLKVRHVGVDLNRYIVASRRVDVIAHAPEGMEMPEDRDAAEMADSTYGPEPMEMATAAAGEAVTDTPF